MENLALNHAPLTGIDPLTLYRIMRLRTEVFVGEQQITSEPELDGADELPTTQLFWAQNLADDDAPVLATLRLLNLGASEVTIGRVATAKPARGQGLAARLLGAAAEVAAQHGALVVEVHAQAHLARWYGSLGYEQVGPQFQEAGIAHVTMRRRANN